MIVTRPYSEKMSCDFCVIGAGPAGIILALELARNTPDKTIFLIEYGDLGNLGTNGLDEKIQNKNPANHHDPYECTNKGLGGTSISWGGRCVMYDEIDFIPRPIVGENCTWDSSLLTDCKLYTAQAAEYFECGSEAFNTDSIPRLYTERIAERFIKGDVTDSVVERWSMPTRFGDRYRKEIESLKNLHFIHGLEAREFSEPDSSGKITNLITRERLSNQSVNIISEQFIIATGTQESTRLLLRNPQIFCHLSEIPSSLGRYYQGHISGKIATIHLSGDPKKTDYGFQRSPDGSYFRRRFQLSNETLFKNNLLNTAIWLDNPLYHDPSHGNGAMSLMYLAMVTPWIGKRLAPPAIANSVTKGKVNAIHRHIWNVICDFPNSLLIPLSIFFRRYCLKRKLPGIFLYNPKNQYALHFHAEQQPSPSNCMKLADDGETLEIHYELSEDDITSVIKNHEILDSHLQKCDCGHLEYWFPKDRIREEIRAMSRDGIHQSGTTRISDHSDSGVVNRDLLVWGTSNLYVCSSSVFPTSGQANPTFFLGVFAARLAQHLLKK